MGVDSIEGDKLNEKEFREKFDKKLNEFGFKYALSEDREDEIIIHYEAEDFEDKEKSIVLVFDINKKAGKIYVTAINYIKERDIFKSYGISLNDLFDVLKASYEKGKGFSVKKFIDNLVDRWIRWMN